MKSKIVASLLLALAALPSTAQLVSQTSDSSIISSGPGFGQSFTAPANASIQRISVRLLGAYNGNLQIYNGSAGSGSGAPVYTETGISIAGTTSGGPLSDIVLTTPFNISAGNSYTFVLDGLSFPLLATNDPYAGGTAISGSNIVEPTWDLPFQIWAAAPPAPTGPASIPTLSQWGVIALTSVLGMFGVASLRRRPRSGR